MSKRQITGILGGIIPILFIIGFYLLTFEYNPGRFKLSDGEFIVGFLLEGMPGYELAKYFNYLFIGFIIISFSLSLLKNTSNRGLNKIGKILILISGVLYLSFGFTDIGETSDLNVFLLLARIIFILLLGAIGFIMISDEFLEISNNKSIKWILFSFGIAILLNGVLSLLAMEAYPPYMGLVGWLIYFAGLGIIGLSLLNPRPANNS